MSIEARYADGVFAVPGKIYRVFSEEELRGLSEDMAWLQAAESAFSFWNNEEDAVYDSR